MKRAAILSLLFAFTAVAQEGPRFTVTDVHASPRNLLGGGMRGPFFGDNRYEVRFANMVGLIQTAYGVDTERISGGPNWLMMDQFDIFALAPPNSTAESRKLMLQALLADRFQLKFHTGSRPTPVYKLTAGKNPKLQESSSEGGGCDFKIERTGAPPAPGGGDTPRAAMQMPVIVYTCKGITMAALAVALPGIPTANLVFGTKPVVDQTGLTGTYDFALRFTPAMPAGVPTSGNGIPLMEALDQQLGLKLELGTASLPALVVDSANKPSANAPGVEKTFPPVPTEFDAAEMKPTPPGQMAQAEIKNGRVILPGITVQNLMWLCWDISPQTEIINAPKWLNTDRYDVIAKAPAGMALGDLTQVSTERRGSIPINLDALRPMLRNLLIEKFKITTHTEDRPKAAYTLLAVKPKLQKADPSRYTDFTDASPGGDGKGGPAPGTRGITVHNMTMAEFVKAIPQMDFSIQDVADGTGLEGRWDFTITFTMNIMINGQVRGGDGPQSGSGGQQASDPTGGMSFADAVSKQLGLKLEQTKRPQPVLVIDHIESKPVE